MSHEIISRAEALACGLNHYFTGKPCKHGHIDIRRVCDKKCSSCHRQTVRRYEAANKDAILQRRRDNYQEKREVLREYNRAYYCRNIESRRALSRASWHKNKAQNLERAKKYKKTNSHVTNRNNQTRRATRKQAVPVWFGEWDKFVIQEASELALLRRNATATSWHVDHMIPLSCKSACGLHVAENLQVIPGKMNLRKQRRFVLTRFAEWVMAL